MDRRQLVRHCLVVAGRTVAFGGVVVAGTANVPGDRQGVSGAARDGWLVWVAVGFAVAWLVWAVPSASDRPARRRVTVHGAMAGGCAAGIALVVANMPSGGVDLSFPLTALGLALGLAGALMALAANLQYPGDDSGDRDRPSGRVRWLVRGGAVTVAALLTVGLAVSVVPAWVVAANTVADTVRGSPQGFRSALDGSVAWRVSNVPDPLDGHFVGTAGGVAVLAEDGRVRMLDPASGRQRWSFRRQDATSRFLPYSAAVSGDGRWLAVVYRVGAPRRRWVDDLRNRDRAWVFDTLSGRMLADVPVGQDVNPLAVTADLVLVTAALGDRVDLAAENGRWLTALDHDGDVAWRYRPGDGCAPYQVLATGDDLLALFGCEEDQALVRLDARTGRVRWTWRAGRFGGDAASQGHAQRRQEAVVAVAGDTAVVDVRVIYQTRQSGTTGEVTGVDVWHNLVGLRLADGVPAWQRRDLHYGKLADDRSRVGAVTGLHAARGTVVIAEQNEFGPERARPHAIALRAFAPATGEPAWSVDLPGSEFSVASRTDSVAVLADGRLVVTYLDFAAPSGDDRCVVAAWEPASGSRQADVRLYRTARDAVGSRCATSFPVEVGDGVAVEVAGRGLVMLR